MQTTIIRPVSCYGIGTHSGQITQLTLEPASKDTGIVFVRTDVSSLSNVVYASYNNVSETLLATTIQNDAGIKVATIEHLMAALWGCGIDNVVVKIDGSEVPIMDGSSQPFVFLVECAGTKLLNSPKKIIRILREISITHKDSEIIATPDSKFSLSVEIDFTSKAIGKQSMNIDNRGLFKDNIASARTFGFIREVEYLKNQGLAKGASLENAIGIDNDTILNPEGLRFENEFARHKLLDSIGDFYTAGANFQGHFSSTKPGHYLNNLMLRHILENPNNFEIGV
jgi:UDP-3-O-[3-hydroxymyristoyl] N-acetylglucosamine deacetylase